jgi:hypothetical protein
LPLLSILMDQVIQTTMAVPLRQQVEGQLPEIVVLQPQVALLQLQVTPLQVRQDRLRPVMVQVRLAAALQ